MDTLYLGLVIVLFVLAISDLVVGVSNDAVNFLNSAIGAKAAPFKVVMIIAALGIVAGATFSSGMMEVARKGIFHPEYFYFTEIMVIFLAVMITDVILLDMFNTFGMPTSTTVSIVFELLGAAVAVSLLKVSAGEQIITTSDGIEKVATLSDYINTEKAVLIISGILLSVVVAFTVGAIVQYLSRIVFSFNYESRISKFGAIWGGLAIAAITYFMLIKGLKGSEFASIEVQDGVSLKNYVSSHALLILGICFFGWTVIMQLLKMLFNVDILKIIVLVGTFALAMAFAGNDLVNFIGVPIAGWNSYESFIAAGGVEGGINPDLFSMSDLAGKKVETPIMFLLLAGLVMVITLWTSKKAKSVVKTSLDLSRQDEGEERFGSSALARSLVRFSTLGGKFMTDFIPAFVTRRINNQFDQTEYLKKQDALGADAPAFDMIRASVNLVVASILIAIATSLKLPLSTTYVTFMVAMGTSLADKAWGRESAVYRITGVVSVIGGWFFTAFSAFTAAFLVALFISKTGEIGIAIMIIIAIFVVVRTHAIHKKEQDKKEKKQALTTTEDDNTQSKIQEKCSLIVSDILTQTSTLYNDTIVGFSNEDRKKLKDSLTDIKELNIHTKDLKDNIFSTIKKFEADLVETGHYYVQVLDYLREIAHCLTFINQPCFKHIDNSHTGLSEVQIEELLGVKNHIIALIDEIISVIKDKKYESVDNVLVHQQDLLTVIKKARKKQIKRIKAGEAKTRLSMLYFGILHESKDLTLYLVNLLKAQRDFELLTDEEDSE